MPIPVENVGSLPRPEALQRAYRDYDQGTTTFQQLCAAQDAACEDSIKRMEETGQPYVTDGEQRASSFATYPLIDTLGGTGLAEHLAADGQYFAIFDDGHRRRLPRLTGGPFRYKNYASSFLALSKVHATLPLKQAVISPSMLRLLYPLDEVIEGYPREQFLSDLVGECEKDIRLCFEVGAVRVSIDFTEGRLALKNDPRNPWTGRGLLESFVVLVNRVLDRFSADERKNIGIHACPGGDCNSVHSLDVDYSDLFPSLFKLNAGYFLLQCTTEPSLERTYKLISQHSNSSQTIFIGVTNPLLPRVETPQEICSQLVEAAKFIPKERLGATDDCGFSPFCDDKKAGYGGAGPDSAREAAFSKIRARVEGARLASEVLGI